MKKVTIQDIAAEMGLSRNTVAKALNGGLVSPQTRHAVVQKAWQMGYTKLDENLVEEVKTTYRKANTGTILVLFNQMQSVFWTRVLAGISNAVNDEGYRMQLYVVNEKDRDGEEAGRLIAGDVKGVIFLSVFPARFVKGIARRKLPMTFFNSPVNAQEYIKLGDVINVEGFYSMNNLTNYVIEQKGCTKFAYIGFAEVVAHDTGKVSRIPEFLQQEPYPARRTDAVYKTGKQSWLQLCDGGKSGGGYAFYTGSGCL